MGENILSFITVTLLIPILFSEDLDMINIVAVFADTTQLHCIITRTVTALRLEHKRENLGKFTIYVSF